MLQKRVSMNNKLAAAFATVLVALSVGASAQDTRDEDRTRHDAHASSGSVRQDVRDAGHSLHQGVRETGHAIHQGLRATGHAIHEGVKATGHAIHRGVDKVTGK